MRKELGKWLMDIAKYITTAVLLASVFSEMNSGWVVYLCSTIAVTITLCGGLWMLKDKNDDNNKK